MKPWTWWAWAQIALTGVLWLVLALLLWEALKWVGL